MRTLLSSLILAALPYGAEAAFVTRTVGGSNTPASIQTTVDQFRADLGEPNNGNAAGPLVTGRREINWDGGGSTATTPAGTPFAGFQGIRGALFTTPGTGFVQAPVDGLATQFGNATYGTTFTPFSPVRLFAPIGSNITDVLFFVPGTSAPATVGGFGAVFSDVDLATSTSLQFFDVSNNLLFSAFAPVGTVANGSLSFLGASGNAGEAIFRVRITNGNAALGPNDNPAGGVDVVAFDDFLYREPTAALAVPEPSSWAMLLAGIGALGALQRRRRYPRK